MAITIDNIRIIGAVEAIGVANQAPTKKRKVVKIGNSSSYPFPPQLQQPQRLLRLQRMAEAPSFNHLPAPAMLEERATPVAGAVEVVVIVIITIQSERPSSCLQRNIRLTACHLNHSRRNRPFSLLLLLNNC